MASSGGWINRPGNDAQITHRMIIAETPGVNVPTGPSSDSEGPNWGHRDIIPQWLMS